jgi:hypothetical protein
MQLQQDSLFKPLPVYAGVGIRKSAGTAAYLVGNKRFSYNSFGQAVLQECLQHPTRFVSHPCKINCSISELKSCMFGDGGCMLNLVRRQTAMKTNS